MLWIALHFPRLAIECMPGLNSPEQPDPVAVFAQIGRREKIIAVNTAAEAEGIHPGLSRHAAHALSRGLRSVPRQPIHEVECLNSLGCWGLQFTPAVNLDPAPALLLEIEGCLRYFGGLDKLQDKLLRGLESMGYTYVHACAPTPLGALWLAHWQPGQIITSLDELRTKLVHAPVELLGLEAELVRHIGQLQQLGLRQIGQIRQLPRNGLAHRIGPPILRLIDLAFGDQTDSRTLFTAPPVFEHSIELDWPAEHAGALIFATNRQIQALAGFLLARGAGCEEIILSLSHEDLPATQLICGFGQATRDASLMMAVVREKLGRHQLAAPVRGLRLKTGSLTTLHSEALDLFGQGQREGNIAMLLARLKARLGDTAVHRIYPANDHRPEKAWSHQAISQTQYSPCKQDNRPGWLLDHAEPIIWQHDRLWYHGPLWLETACERIESGWWDGDTVHRDYHCAHDAQGQRYWVFRDLHSQQWFIHGLFA
ncbi:DNA polymerase Y family protein [Burkholderiaceae bacterium DAT-1]|nr:DNA polymerase Y family protein [Burkholderiaceae bacterium DAT-1]